MAKQNWTILFDLYGTLLDVHSAIQKTGAPLGPLAPAISQLWRQKQLEYSWVYSLRSEYLSFRKLTELALDFALAYHKISDTDLRNDVLRSYEDLAAFPEVAAELTQLKSKGHRLAVLSNGDPDMLQIGLSSAGILSSLDAVLSVAAIKVFKPDRRVYQMGLDWAQCPLDQIAFVSSNAWDAGGAAAFGFRTFWINRMRQPDEYNISSRATEIPDLSALGTTFP